MQWAGIGTRNPTEYQKGVCYSLGEILAEKGYILHTGAATGADQAFANGVNSKNGKVILHLPWNNFERNWIQTLSNFEVDVISKKDHEAHKAVRFFHPAPQNLGRSFLLMSRNYRIIKPFENNVDFVIAARSDYGYRTGKGGTEFGVRVAEALGIRVFSIFENESKDFNLSEFKLNFT